MKQNLLGYLDELQNDLCEKINVRFLRPMLKQAFLDEPNAVEFCECNGESWFVMKDGARWDSGDYDLGPGYPKDPDSPEAFVPIMQAILELDHEAHYICVTLPKDARLAMTRENVLRLC